MVDVAAGAYAIEENFRALTVWNYSLLNLANYV
jgi:hypothetical protein